MELNSHLILALLPLLTVCFLVPSIQAISVEYCDKKGEYPVTVQDIQISPDPIVPSKPATFTISASAAPSLGVSLEPCDGKDIKGKTISGGKVVIEVSLFGVHVHTETHNLCEETYCPISEGKFELSHSQNLPVFTPPGSYTLKMEIKDESKLQLTCITFNFNIGFGSYVADN